MSLLSNPVQRGAALGAAVSLGLLAAGATIPAFANPTYNWGGGTASAAQTRAQSEPQSRPVARKAAAKAKAKAKTAPERKAARERKAAPDRKAQSTARSRPAAKAKSAAKQARPEPAVQVIPDGQRLVVVSIARQKASFFANGQLVRQAPVSTGTKSHPTPMGVFSVIQKNRHHVSNLYHAKMPFMQRLTWSGTALHQGPLPGYPASHGCVRLPQDFAELLWGQTRLGARVIVTRDEASPAEIAHPKLFAPVSPAPPPLAAAAPVRTASAEAGSAVASDAPATAETVGRAGQAPSSRDLAENAMGSAEIARRKSPVSVFISRKDGRLYVRQAMEPLFDAPVTFEDSAATAGTHVFTAMEPVDGGASMRWTVVSIPSAYPREAPPAAAGKNRHNPKEDRKVKAAAAAHAGPPPSPAATLDRISIPQDAARRIGELLIPGSSLIVSDNGISHETGKYTDFIVLTQ